MDYARRGLQRGHDVPALDFLTASRGPSSKTCTSARWSSNRRRGLARCLSGTSARRSVRSSRSGTDACPVKNSIRPSVTERERHGDTLADRVGAQPSSLTTGSRDDPRPRCLGLRPRRPRQLSRRLAGECRPPSSTGGAAAISRSTPAPPAGPALLGRALTPSLPLALSHRRAYDLVL